jgi:hypothetical protein
MLARIRTVVAVALLTGFASAALARPMVVPIMPGPGMKACVTDEGQGRFKPCDAGSA